MAYQQQAEEERKRDPILSVSFNRNYSCIGVGHEDGYIFHSLKHGFDNLEHSASIPGDEKNGSSISPKRVFIVERFQGSSLVAYVSMNQTRKLWIVHSMRNEQICATSFPSTILAVKMNRNVIVVCLEDMVSIHDVRTMKMLHKISDTPNRHGIIDLCANGSNLAFPGDNGKVVIFDTDSLISTFSIQAHTTRVVMVSLNQDGTMVATASMKGTVIRVFETKKGNRLYEFTRGVKRCVTVSSMAFSDDSKYLCLSSNTETVHIFHLVHGVIVPAEIKQAEASQEGITGWVSYFSSQCLPGSVNEMLYRGKSVATARLPVSGSRTAVSISRFEDDPAYYVLVASAEGYLFCYTLDTESGECSLVRQHRIGPNYAEVEDGSLIDDKYQLKPSPGTSANQGTSSVPTTSKEKGSPVSASSSPQEIHKSLKSEMTSKSSSGMQSTCSGQGKPAPPPIPPAPKKRGDTGIASVNSASKSALMTAMSTNPFEMDENTPEFNCLSDTAPQKAKSSSSLAQSVKTKKRQNFDVTSGKSTSSKFADNKDSAEFDNISGAPADLGDMSQFPPLS